MVDDTVIWYASPALKPWIPLNDTLSLPSVLSFSLPHHPTPSPLSIKGTMHERVQLSATRWFRWNLRIRLNSQSDNALWNWAELRVYASLNQVIISSSSVPGYFLNQCWLISIEFPATKIRKNGITIQSFSLKKMILDMVCTTIVMPWRTGYL